MSLIESLEYDLIFKLFRNDFISIADILEIHKRVLGHVDPIEGGEFRR